MRPAVIMLVLFGSSVGWAAPPTVPGGLALYPSADTAEEMESTEQRARVIVGIGAGTLALGGLAVGFGLVFYWAEGFGTELGHDLANALSGAEPSEAPPPDRTWSTAFIAGGIIAVVLGWTATAAGLMELRELEDLKKSMSASITPTEGGVEGALLFRF